MAEFAHLFGLDVIVIAFAEGAAVRAVNEADLMAVPGKNLDLVEDDTVDA